MHRNISQTRKPPGSVRSINTKPFLNSCVQNLMLRLSTSFVFGLGQAEGVGSHFSQESAVLNGKWQKSRRGENVATTLLRFC